MIIEVGDIEVALILSENMKLEEIQVRTLSDFSRLD